MDFTATAPAETGGITLEQWEGISGTSVANLTSNAAYPNSPTSVTTLEGLFEAPTDISANFGRRVRGWFRLPTTGAYTFRIASDDNSDLWLSTTASEANKVEIASVTGFTNSREWMKFTSQTSSAITGSVTVQGRHAPGAGVGAQTFTGPLNYGATASLRW